MENDVNKKALWKEQKRIYRQNRKEYTLIFTKAEVKELEGYANEKQMKVPEFLKALIQAYQNNTGYIVPKENSIRELILETRKIGTNVNQIARYVNTNKMISGNDFQKLQGCLSALENKIISALHHPIKRNT